MIKTVSKFRGKSNKQSLLLHIDALFQNEMLCANEEQSHRAKIKAILNEVNS